MICRLQLQQVFSISSRMTKLPKIVWIIAGVLFAAASVAINHQPGFFADCWKINPLWLSGILLLFALWRFQTKELV